MPNQVTVLSLWCGAGGLDGPFRKMGAKVTPMEEDEKRVERYDILYKSPVFYGRVEHWLSCLQGSKFTGILAQPRIRFGSWKDESKDELETHNAKADIELIEAIVDAVKPKWWLVQLPMRAESLLGDEHPYTLVQYADYGLPQKRRRILYGKFPLPRPTRTRETWRIVPELDRTAPSLTFDEYRWHKGDRFRAGRVWGRKLTLEDIRYVHGWLMDLPNMPSKREENLWMKHIVEDVPQIVSKLFAAEVLSI